MTSASESSTKFLTAGSRLTASSVQQPIEQSFPARDEYTLSSSAFERIKTRLEDLERALRREAEEENLNRPRRQDQTADATQDHKLALESGDNAELQLTQR
jgi:hypothetical protein